jgi:two-component system phosphate regulon response regulator OmpR
MTGSLTYQRREPLPDNAPHVLVVDDDQRIRDLLGRYLFENGFRVTTASDSVTARASMRGLSFDLVILDRMMPGEGGLELARALKTISPVPICMLTAKAEPEDRVEGLEAGVDDYVTKPHSMRELALRLRALSRRRRSIAPPETLNLGALKIDRSARRIELGGESPELTRREFDLLLCLAERAGRVQSRDVLVNVVWGELPESGRVVDTTVKRLRKKLGAHGPSIKTIRGIGYTLIVD